MRKYVRKYFNNIKWNNLDFKNNCTENIQKSNRIITLNNSQNFVSNFFVANSFNLVKSIMKSKFCIVSVEIV